MTCEQYRAAGGPAFPTTGYADGMTLRDWFAGQALAWLLDTTPTGAGGFPDSLVRRAYQIADAMIQNRARE